VAGRQRFRKPLACATGTFNPRLFALLWDFYERKVALG
jgi:hypothetical protein